MNFIKNYNLFIFENYVEMIEVFNEADILESIVTNSDELLKTIDAEKITDMFITFGLNQEDFQHNITIEDFFNNKEFERNLNKMNLKKSDDVTSSDENETYLPNSVDLKFFTVHEINSSVLEKPDYIFIQIDNNPINCYKVNSSMKKFYDKLTNKTIEIKKGDDNYIYVTSNGGSEWNLQKSEKNQETDTFKEIMTKDDIKNVLLDKKVSITILA